MLRSKRNNYSIVIYPCLIMCFLMACTVSQVGAVSMTDTGDYFKAGEQDVQAWRDMKFGLFIHWGPVSLKGTEIGWSRGGERRGRNDKSTGSIPVEVYDNLYKQFNPVKFDAEQWVQMKLAENMSGVQMKSFKVPKAFLKTIESMAVKYKYSSIFPDAPHVVDLKHPHQYGLRETHIEMLKEAVIQGTGRTGG